MRVFSFTSGYRTNRKRRAGLLDCTAHLNSNVQNETTTTVLVKKRDCGWSLRVFQCRQAMRQRYWPFGSWVICGGCLRWALRETRRGETLGAVQNTRLCLGSTSTLAIWQWIAYLHYAKGWRVRVTRNIYTAVIAARRSRQDCRHAKPMKIDDEGTLRRDRRYM